MSDFDPYLYHRDPAPKPRPPKRPKVTFGSRPEGSKGEFSLVGWGALALIAFIAFRGGSDSDDDPSQAVPQPADMCEQTAQPPVGDHHDNLWDMAERCLPGAPLLRILTVVSRELVEREGDSIVHVGETVVFDISE